MGKKTGFIQRERKKTGSGFVQALVFGMMANPASTRQEINQAASQAGMRLSTQGLDKRFTAKAAYFLDQILAEAVKQMVTAVPQSQSLLSRFKGVYIGDSTVIALPDALAGVFRGTTGSEAAAVKLAVQWEMETGGVQMWLSDATVHDQRTGVVARQLPTGALRLNDLGFFNLQVFDQDVQQGRYFFSRYKGGTLIYDGAGKAVELAKRLKRQPRQAISLPIQLGAQRLACRLIALPLEPEQVARRRERLRKTARRKQQTVSPTSLALAAWTLYVTNLSDEQLSVSEAATLGATRWQIECLFKLWKGSGLLDESRSQDPHRVWCEFYAKLLALLLQHWLMLLGCWHRLNRSLHRALQVLRKQAFAFLAVLNDIPALIHTLQHTASVLADTCLLSKRAAHPLTFQSWIEAALS